MNRDEISDQLLTLLAAGHETTATTLAWAVERLRRHPDLSGGACRRVFEKTLTRVATFGAMNEPVARRPYMPGYGILAAGQGRGLLPWPWAQERLKRSHDFWLATVTPDGAPHLMPVWAVWHEGRLWFSSSNGSRKARNLARDSRCSLSTDNPLEPIVVHGRAERVNDRDALLAMLEAENAKYGASYGLEMVDPASNSVFALLPEWVFALDSSDFTGSPTKFIFSSAPD